MRMDDLQWRAKSIVTGFHNGLHRSPKHGFSVEFSEYRPFSTGDDPRSIDWKLYARCDRYYVKKFEDETNRRCYLVVDQSRSMHYGTLAYSKLEYARTVAATLAFYLSLQRDSVGLVTFDREIADVLPARFRTGQLKRILSMLSRQGNGDATNMIDPINHLAEIVRQRSLIVVVSDFLVPVDTVFPSFSRLSARGHEIVLIQTLDPSETEWSVDKPAMVRDVETGEEIFVDPRIAKGTYRKKFETHQANWQRLANENGMSWIPLLTDQSIEIALFELLRYQQRTGASVQRRSVSPASY